jgi:uncharacterized protein (TIGR01244 family)
MQKTPLDEHFTVAAQITPADVDALAAEGYVAIVCNRPDGEEPGQPPAADIAAACQRQQLAFYHLPVGGPQLPAGTVERLAAILESAEGPVLAYCRSGQRSAYLYSQVRR